MFNWLKKKCVSEGPVRVWQLDKDYYPTEEEYKRAVQRKYIAGLKKDLKLTLLRDRFSAGRYVDPKFVSDTYPGEVYRDSLLRASYNKSRFHDPLTIDELVDILVRDWGFISSTLQSLWEERRKERDKELEKDDLEQFKTQRDTNDKN